MKLLEREQGIEVELKENVVSVIVVEDIALRLLLIKELYLQITGQDGNWLLVENEKTFELSKCAELILEPFSLQLNNKKIKTKLYQDMKEIADDSFALQGLELHSHICLYMENLLEKMSYPLQYKDDWNVVDLFKLYNVELEERYNDVYEKLCHYIELMSMVCEIKLFIIINLKEYLGKNQLQELYKLVGYSKIQLVLIEFNMNAKKIEGEEVFILDKDGCIITY